MSTSGTDVGRLTTAEAKGPIIFDSPEETTRAMLNKQDEIIDKLNSILDAIETATDAATLFSGLDVAGIKAQLGKIELTV